MSVDGTVLCDCLETGLASLPPCPVFRDQRWTHAVDNGRQAEVRSWAEAACAHPQFWLVTHQVRRMALLGAMLVHGGAAAFPAVHAAMPTWNGGEVGPADSARCLADIERLGQLMADRSMTVIVDADDGTVVFVDPDSQLVASSRAHTPGWSIISYDEGGAVVGSSLPPGVLNTSTWLGDDGVVRVRAADGAVLFAAREFVQERDGSDWTFRDVLTGAIVRHCSPVSWWDDSPDQDAPHRIRVETRPIDIDHYLGGVADLRELFDTSARTGRPVIWS